MEMDKLGVVTTFIHNIVVYNIPLPVSYTHLRAHET